MVLVPTDRTGGGDMNDEVLRQGSNGDDVSELQTHLHQLTFYAGTIDGYFGSTTEEAVIAYREWSGAGYGTEADQELRTALAGHAEQYDQQDAETPFAVDVTDLQTHLHQLNFYAGTFDGHLGPVTETALTAYREWSGLGADTDIDQLRPTLAAHAEQYADQGTEPAATEPAATEPAANQPKAIPPVANDEIDDSETEEAPAPDLEDAVL
jgi:peptidoglycan hydrolase-like protein with peptidoglycan-binding domain